MLITGPARGIGAALARTLAARGARLALVGMEPELLEALANELGPRHVWFECDVTSESALRRAVDGTVAALGGIDVVVTNAGIAAHGTVAVTPPAALARVIEVNLIGTILTAAVTLPHVVARQGYFLLISSAAAVAVAPGLAAYSASKSGVEQFSNALRLELAHKGVQVGCAHPSWIDTDMVRDAQQDLGGFRAMLRKLPGPFGTVTPLDDCAKALADAIARRQRRIYIPRSLAKFAALRQFFMGPVMEPMAIRDANKIVPRLENEAAGLTRVFGEHSVERRER